MRGRAGRAAVRAAAALALLAAAPAPAAALAGNRAVALQAALSGGREALALEAAHWLDGDVDVLARVTWASAPRTGVRGTAGDWAAEAGLRWTPDVGRWRPFLGVVAGVRLPAGGRAAAPGGALEGGLERRLAGGWSATAGLGLRLRERERAAWEAALGVRLAF